MKKYLSIFISALFLLSAFGCTPSVSSDTTNDTKTESTPPSDDTTSAQTVPVTTAQVTEAVTTADLNLSVPDISAGATKENIIYAADYGAVGDGVTNDGPALSKAVNAAATDRCTLKLEAGKTYYIETALNKTNGFTSPFAVDGKRFFTVDGCGATISVKPGITFMAVVSCKDVAFKNLNFKYATPVYMVGTVTAVKGTKVTYSTDIEPNADSCTFNNIGFSIKFNEGIQGRPHQFFSKMVKTASKTVEVTYNAAGGYRVGDKVFLPNPYIGHMIGEVFYFGANAGQLYLENINVYSAPSFIFSIKGNEADIIMNNVDIVPEPDTGREIEMVAWRDGYHCKDNRGRLIWTECDTGVIFDDVCNISNTNGKILSVISDTELEVTNMEFYDGQNRIVGYDCEVGDVVDVYNSQKSKYAGRATVTKVKKNSKGSVTITLDKALKNVDETFVVANLMTAAPGSLVENCRGTGTFRFRGEAYIKDCDFNILCMWIMVEGGVEGPIPQNIVFENCRLSGGEIDLDSYDRSNGRYSRQISDMITGIKFINCDITSTVNTKMKVKYEVID